MDPPPISDSVRKLILEHVDSVAEMEALLLLRDEPQGEWDAERVAGRLYITPAEATRLLATLTKRGLFREHEENKGCHSYGPASAELSQAVDALAETYRTRLIPLTKLIHSKSANSLQHFANAFRLRKET